MLMVKLYRFRCMEPGVDTYRAVTVRLHMVMRYPGAAGK